ncbi:hypothetical protein [Vibrio phage P23]|nr:hypothetical protein [Vibrio phage P23]
MSEMIDQRTKDICKKRAIYPNAPSFKEHQEFMLKSSRAMWKRYIESIKTNRP